MPDISTALRKLTAMFGTRIPAFGCAMAIASCTFDAASAQQNQVPRYTPDRPTVSPYINLLRNDTGGVPNYYSFVRPQLDQQAVNRRNAATFQNQGIAVMKLETLAAGGTNRPTGSAATFRNYSHYYPRMQNAGR